ncbi:MAG: DNA mismatch repair protein MutS [Desulfovibrio sp.]|nr:DNA mismatch repair protein MutS [Desulfovibrio sp.]
MTHIKRTPMFEQYLRIKADYSDALLFYRMGDFYELFFDDAVTAARELQIALTSRSKDSADPIPMCGVPWHAAHSYIAQLVDRGFHVAVCEQTEDPKMAKGLVQRAVTSVITPGTVLDDANLQNKSHNYLGALCCNASKEGGAFAWADISTGQWSGVDFKRRQDMWQWVQKLAPSELLIAEKMELPTTKLEESIHIVRMPNAHFEFKKATQQVLQAQQVADAAVLGLDNKKNLMCACGAILAYLDQTQKRNPDHLMPFKPLDLGRRLMIDEITERNLEIFVRLNGHKGKGTLRHEIDETMTPMGGRLLEDMLRHPWRDAAIIERVQDVVAFFHDHDNCRELLRDALRTVYDLERLSTRIHLNRANPRDFISLRNSLTALPLVQKAFLCLRPEQEEKELRLPKSLAELNKTWDNLTDCAQLLDTALVESPPTVITDGGLFKIGYNAELDHLLDLIEHGEQKVKELLCKEQARTGLSKLKIGYNRVFGYYYEISRAAHSAPLPDYFIRRQTLANAERFTTAELKSLEDELLSASDKRNCLEYRMFQELREHISSQRHRITHMAALVAQLDYWQSLAQVGRRNIWCRPQLTDTPHIDIRDGRHPVIESIIGNANFVPNSFRLDTSRRLCLLTGPNMAGKSTILRQVAIICLLAQMGSMVPAEQATLGIVDRLFSRVGASDNLAQGHSTFMVEMVETARILRQATKRSLIILDEIGRGTSTYDGVALAWAVVEDLVKRAGGEVRTLFATHYHELTSLEGRITGVFTMNIAIREHNGEILFLHKLLPGPADRSYGVEVARLAGIPAPVVQRARQILTELEHGRALSRKSTVISLPGLELSEKNFSHKKRLPYEEDSQPSVEHPLLTALRDLDLDTLSPMSALKLLAEWKTLLGKNNG